MAKLSLSTLMALVLTIGVSGSALAGSYDPSTARVGGLTESEICEMAKKDAEVQLDLETAQVKPRVQKRIREQAEGLKSVFRRISPKAQELIGKYVDSYESLKIKEYTDKLAAAQDDIIQNGSSSERDALVAKLMSELKLRSDILENKVVLPMRKEIAEVLSNPTIFDPASNFDKRKCPVRAEDGRNWGSNDFMAFDIREQEEILSKYVRSCDQRKVGDSSLKEVVAPMIDQHFSLEVKNGKVLVHASTFDRMSDKKSAEDNDYFISRSTLDLGGRTYSNTREVDVQTALVSTNEFNVRQLMKSKEERLNLLLHKQGIGSCVDAQKLNLEEANKIDTTKSNMIIHRKQEELKQEEPIVIPALPSDAGLILGSPSPAIEDAGVRIRKPTPFDKSFRNALEPIDAGQADGGITVELK